MGFKPTGTCPYTPEPILGSWVKAYFVDSNSAFGSTVYASTGLDITMTEIGAYDDDYFGGFALMKWDLKERNGVTLDPVYGGTWIDWDVGPSAGNNHGIVSDVFNGYALWDWTGPEFAYGFLDPRMTTDYCGLKNEAFVAHRAQEMGERCLGGTGSDGCGGYGLWQGLAPDNGFLGYALLWDDVVNGDPLESGPHTEATPWTDDHFGLLVSKGVRIIGGGTESIIQAKFGVDVSDVGTVGGTDVGLAEAHILELAKRAAVWSGFARGDVNLDGCVNLVDACMVLKGCQLYPDSYNVDVDGLSGLNAVLDGGYLLQYVSGLGPAPIGAWRFLF